MQVKSIHNLEMTISQVYMAKILCKDLLSNAELEEFADMY